jgi:hypothetical protein
VNQEDIAKIRLLSEADQARMETLLARRKTLEAQWQEVGDKTHDDLKRSIVEIRNQTQEYKKRLKFYQDPNGTEAKAIARNILACRKAIRKYASWLPRVGPLQKELEIVKNELDGYLFLQELERDSLPDAVKYIGALMLTRERVPSLVAEFANPLIGTVTDSLLKILEAQGEAVDRFNTFRAQRLKHRREQLVAAGFTHEDVMRFLLAEVRPTTLSEQLNDLARTVKFHKGN